MELLELLEEQEREIQDLKRQLEEKNQHIEQHTLYMNQFGNISQAALALNGVFEAAQRAADQYVASVKAVVDQKLSRCEVPFSVPKGLGQQDQPSVPSAESASDQMYTVDEILKELAKSEVLRECADSMNPSSTAAPDGREDAG